MHNLNPRNTQTKTLPTFSFSLNVNTVALLKKSKVQEGKTSKCTQRKIGIRNPQRWNEFFLAGCREPGGEIWRDLEKARRTAVAFHFSASSFQPS